MPQEAIFLLIFRVSSRSKYPFPGSLGIGNPSTASAPIWQTNFR